MQSIHIISIFMCFKLYKYLNILAYYILINIKYAYYKKVVRLIIAFLNI